MKREEEVAVALLVSTQLTDIFQNKEERKTTII